MKKFLDNSAGSMLMETVLVMPLVLSLVFGALQFAHIYIARQVVNYAAFSAARATLSVPVGQEEENAMSAAKRILCWLLLSPDSMRDGAQMPNPESEEVSKRIELTLSREGWNQAVELRFAFPLVMPIAAQIIGYAMNIPAYDFTPEARGGHIGEMALVGSDMPHIFLTERCALPKPYKIKQ